MPVTAKLSRQFYERLGDEITNELVDWLNAVDESVRGQLYGLNERNWERFSSELRGTEARLDARISALDAQTSSRIAELAAHFDTKLVVTTGGLESRLERRISDVESRMLRWMVGLWLSTILTILATRLV